jgi:hypothetical protein
MHKSFLNFGEILAIKISRKYMIFAILNIKIIFWLHIHGKKMVD